MIKRYDEEYDSMYNELFYDFDSIDMPFQRPESAIRKTIQDVNRFLDKNVYQVDVDMMKWGDWQYVAEASYTLIEIDIRNHFEDSQANIVEQALSLIEKVQEVYNYNESELDWETTATDMVEFLVELRDLLYDLEEASV